MSAADEHEELNYVSSEVASIYDNEEEGEVDEMESHGEDDG